MFFNYIKISIRNILRHKLFSFINIFGLTLSISVCLAALMIIKNQLEFDKFHPHPDRTYRVITEVTAQNGNNQRYATTPLSLGEHLEEYNFVETTTRLYRAINGKATSAGKELTVRGSFTDPAFYDIFGFELESGNKATALSQPYSVVLSKETARRFYGDRNPLGEQFTIEGLGDFTITGVLESSKKKTHLRLGVLASMSTVPLLNNLPSMQNELTDPTWDFDTYVYTYVLLEKGIEKEALSKTLISLSRKATEYLEPETNIRSFSYDVQVMDNISPGEELRFDIGGSKTRSALQLAIWAGFVLVILLMACFNYTNLSIARALKRAREVGMYKIMGAYRHQILAQFVVQATLIALFAIILAYAILPFIPLPPRIMEEVRSVNPDATLIGWFLLFAVFTGLLAGGLPAWLISSVQPVNTFKNFKNIKLIEGLTLRKTLVVVQFTLSLILIIFTTVFYQQTQYAATTDYGFRRENIIDLQLQDADHQLLRDELSGVAGVEEISAISSTFGFFSTGNLELRKKRTSPPVYTSYYSTDRNIITNMDLTLLAGNTFPEEISEDHESYIIINEQSLSPLDFSTPSDAIGQSVWLNDSLQVEVIGVIEDFHFRTLSFSIRPMVLRYKPDEFGYLNIRLASSDSEAVMGKMEEIWEEIAPGSPIQYRYSDQAIYEAHAHKQDVASIGFYALIALTIAGLGLLGMVTYTVEVRTHEVGVRKVLGAGIARVITLLSKEFVLLLAVAGLIGLPVGYLSGLQFLQSYTYHITIGFGTLTFGLVIMFIIGLLAIGTQTWQVARANPVEALRSE